MVTLLELTSNTRNLSLLGGLDGLIERLLLLLYSPSVREVCTNYKVVMFQPRTGNLPDLGSVAICYVAILLIPAPPFQPANQCPPGGGYPLTSLLSLPCRP